MSRARAGRRTSIWARLYDGTTSFDFVGRWKLWMAISGVVILAGLLSLFTRGVNLGIDFEGGTAWEVEAPSVSVDEARDALGDAGLANAEIQVVGGDTLRVQAGPDEADVEDVRGALAALAGSDVSEVSVTDVGPSWGDEITRKAQRALVVFLVAITLYITLRFEWKMALATLIALLHDILVTVGVYSLSGLEVTPATVVALLTILGYSIYDGIVVFDRIDENTKLVTGGRISYAGMVNDSLNQVLMRTLNTSITALLPILSLLIVGSYGLGATTLEEFALALLIGLASSAYSSIFIASPILVLLKQREPRYAALRQRGAGAEAPARREVLRPSADPEPAPVAGGSTVLLADDEPEPAPAPPPSAPGPSIYGGSPTPRGRKRGRRR